MKASARARARTARVPPSPPSPLKVRCHGRIYESFLDTIGATPLVRLARLAQSRDCVADLVGKIEFFNPLASVKDRIGLAMIEDAERRGRLKAGTVVIEPTSGNTGIALAFATAVKGYKLILTMPEGMSLEGRKMLTLLGARLELTDRALGMRGAIARAHELAAALPDALVLQQFDNPANPQAHRVTTAEEIWQDSGGRVDVVVAGVGTGGTMTGVGEALKTRKPSLRMVAVEPEDSAVLSGGMAGAHKIQGIGAGLVPSNLNRAVIDEVVSVSNRNAFATARLAARLEGMPVGISSGAALAAALEVGARKSMAGRMIVVMVPSFAERYLSTELFDES